MKLTSTDHLLIRASIRAPGYGVFLLLGTCATTATSLLIPAALAATTNAVLTHGAAAAATMWLAALLALSALSSLAVSLAGTMITTSNTRWLSRRLVRHIISLGLRGQQKFPPGDMTSRLLDNIPSASAAATNAFGIMTSAVTSLGAIGALWLADWRLGCTFIVSTVLLVILFRPSMRGASSVFLRYEQAQGRIAALLSEALAGIRTIQSSGTADQEAERILRPLPALAAAGRETWSVQRRVTWRATLCFGLVQLSVLVTAGVLVSAGRLSPGAWLATAGYTTLALGALENIDAIVGIARARAGATRVTEVLGTRPDGRVAGTARLGHVSGDLTCRGVTVRSAGQRILDGVDLHVPAGTTVAIVGRSGAGKTTVGALFGRLIEPDEGEVLLDGVAVSALPAEDLHRIVGYAFARPASLGTTIADYIGYGTPHPARAEIERAARIARAHDFIGRLPQGYDTHLADAPLSGGERQRLGIARAVAADARVLVLDDATSSLDTATEAQVNAALRELRAGQTTVIIATGPVPLRSPTASSGWTAAASGRARRTRTCGQTPITVPSSTPGRSEPRARSAWRACKENHDDRHAERRRRPEPGQPEGGTGPARIPRRLAHAGPGAARATRRVGASDGMVGA